MKDAGGKAPGQPPDAATGAFGRGFPCEMQAFLINLKISSFKHFRYPQNFYKPSQK
jgi:hypothetical protein